MAETVSGSDTASRGVGFAAELDPAGPALAALLDSVADLDRTSFAPDVARRLTEIAASLTDDEVRVVFGGHFSSGKSSLVNLLIGRSLLPTGDFPETGVPCELTAGDADRVSLLAADGGRTELPFDTAAIGHEVSLTAADGTYRAEVRDTHRLLITLTGAVPPAGVRWIDSPGINDSAGVTDRATEAATGADVLVWVVNSRQALSEVEQRFLRAHIAEHGPAGVVFVLNAFLPVADDPTWRWFLAERLGYFLGRIEAAGLTEPLPPVVVPVSVLGAGTDPAGFGAPRVRELLASSADPARIALTRQHRAGYRLRELIAFVDAYVDRERDRNERKAEVRAELVALGDRRRAEACRRVADAVPALLHRPGSTEQDTVVAVIAQVNRIAVAHGLLPLSAESVAEVRAGYATEHLTPTIQRMLADPAVTSLALPAPPSPAVEQALVAVRDHLDGTVLPRLCAAHAPERERLTT